MDQATMVKRTTVQKVIAHYLEAETELIQKDARDSARGIVDLLEDLSLILIAREAGE